MADDNPLLSVEEVARFFGGDGRPLNVQTIYSWVRKGKLHKPVKIGSLSRWKKSWCVQLLAEMEGREV